jgi:hypothetical protein
MATSKNVPEQIPEDTLDNIPADKNVDILVADTFVCNGGAEGINETHSANDGPRSRKTLRTPVCVECFGRDDSLKRSVCEPVDYLEEKVRRESALGE